jgi:apolipoprotein N-acyltransferase
MYDKTPINEKTAFTDEVGIRDEKTFYTKHGDIIWCYVTYIVLILIFAGAAMKTYRKISKRKRN